MMEWKSQNFGPSRSSERAIGIPKRDGDGYALDGIGNANVCHASCDKFAGFNYSKCFIIFNYLLV